MTNLDLQSWRLVLGVSQRKAAQLLGVALTTYQEWERGATYGTDALRTIDVRTALACQQLKQIYDTTETKEVTE